VLLHYGIVAILASGSYGLCGSTGDLDDPSARSRLEQRLNDLRAALHKAPGRADEPGHGVLRFFIADQEHGAEGLPLLERTLDDIARGPLRDHVGGGFYRGGR
jgi:hypothetical protein